MAAAPLPQLYYQDLQSYEIASKGSTHFVIRVTMLSGGAPQDSTNIPITELERVLDYIESLEFSGYMHVWSSKSKTLLVLPVRQISKIEITLA